MDSWLTIVLALAMGLLGIGLGWVLHRQRQERHRQEAESEAKRILQEAQREVEARRKEADLEIKDRMLQTRTELEHETRARREEFQAFEKRLTQREEILDRKLEVLDRRERDLAGREEQVRARDAAVSKQEGHWNQLVEEATKNLERLAGMSSEEARTQLMRSMEEEAKLQASARIKRIEDEANTTAEERAWGEPYYNALKHVRTQVEKEERTTQPTSGEAGRP